MGSPSASIGPPRPSPVAGSPTSRRRREPLPLANRQRLLWLLSQLVARQLARRGARGGAGGADGASREHPGATAGERAGRGAPREGPPVAPGSAGRRVRATVRGAAGARPSGGDPAPVRAGPSRAGAGVGGRSDPGDRRRSGQVGRPRGRACRLPAPGSSGQPRPWGDQLRAGEVAPGPFQPRRTGISGWSCARCFGPSSPTSMGSTTPAGTTTGCASG